MMYKYFISGITGVFLTFTTSCGPPRDSEFLEPITPEMFEKLTRSEVFYGYDGSGRVSDVADLGALKLYLKLTQDVTIDSSRRTIRIAGQVADYSTHVTFSGADVMIGKVEYLNGRPYRILPKKWVVSGENGVFVIDSDFEAGDCLFVACLGYVVKTYDISKLKNFP